MLITNLTPIELGLALGLALIGAITIIFLTSSRMSRSKSANLGSDNRATLLFERNLLIDASPMAQSILADDQPFLSDLDRAVVTLSHLFGGLKAAIARLQDGGTTVLSNDNDPNLVLELEGWDDFLRLSLVDVSKKEGIDSSNRLKLLGLQEENELLRSIAFDAPQLIWMTNLEEELVWANRAYLEQAGQSADSGAGTAESWPPPSVFPNQELLNEIAKGGTRLSAPDPKTGDQRWFTVFRVPRTNGTLYIGENADALVNAEVARRNFVQTLTKTFAQLSTGLAIFDKDRRLMIFNPALVDLIDLPVEFLITQPTLATLLNRMREERMLPEQRDFSDWRDRILNIEAAAEQGTYCENWSLLNGRTYRMTGRPHPDGALAFLIEDISADLSRTRQYRSEIALGQSVIDSLDDAVAVFSTAGAVTMTNRAFTQLWGIVDDGRLDDSTLEATLDQWSRSSQPSPFWAELRKFVCTDGPRQKWQETVLLADGRVLSCHVAPLADGGSICTFRSLTDVPARASFSTIRSLPAPQNAVGL